MGIRVAFVTSEDPFRIQAMQEAAGTEIELEVVHDRLSDSEKAKRSADAEFMIISGRISTDALVSCSRLKLIQLMSAGFDTLDIPALHEAGIRVANNSGAIAPSVAEHAITLMLAVKRRLVESWSSVQQRKWNADAKRSLMTELGGSVVGIVGLGAIGRQVAKRLKCWDVDLLYYDVVDVPREIEEECGARRVDLDDLLRESDVVTLHVPLTHRTSKLIGERELRLMKNTAILINTCRGPVVDEAALYRALQENWIAGAGLDVLEVEPTPGDNPILDLPNALVTPHTAGSSTARVRRASAFAIANIIRVHQGEEPQNLVVVQ